MRLAVLGMALVVVGGCAQSTLSPVDSCGGARSCPDEPDAPSGTDEPSEPDEPDPPDEPSEPDDEPAPPFCAGKPEGATCSLASGGGGYCLQGSCVECVTSGHCTGSAQCARAVCTADHRCAVVTLHDGIGDGSPADAGWVSTPVMSPEYVLTTQSTKVRDIVWDGTSFMTVFGDSSQRWHGARMAPDGTVIDPLPWSLGDSSYSSIAFDGSKYLVLGFNHDDVSGHVMVTYNFVTSAGAPVLGGTKIVDFECRYGANVCGPMHVAYGGGRFLALYNGGDWRTTKYALIETNGSVAKRGYLPAPVMYSGYFASAAYDGERFAVAFADEEHFSNACEIFGTKIKPDGSDAYLTSTPLFTIANDYEMASAASVTAGGPGGYILNHTEGTSTLSPALVPAAATLDVLVSTMPRSIHDGRHYVMAFNGPWVDPDCDYYSICGLRVRQDGTHPDPKPFRISSADPAHETDFAIATSGARHAVAYGKQGVGVVVRFFETCP
jgi:hypothetical protein